MIVICEQALQCKDSTNLILLILKIMKIKLRSKDKANQNYLWHDSPCCMNYVSNFHSMDGTNRFEFGSIYYKDQVDKPKKIFNQFQKPDILLQQYRRQIIEASHPKYNTAAKKNKQMTEKQKIKTRSMSSTAATHLYQVPTKTDYKYDIHGYRAHQFGNYNVKQIQSKVKNAKKFFSFSRRIDLSRPLNFFPGPGTYDVKNMDGERNEQQKPQTQRNHNSRTCTQFHKIKYQNIQNPQTQRQRLSRQFSSKQN